MLLPLLELSCRRKSASLRVDMAFAAALVVAPHGTLLVTLYADIARIT